MSAGPLRLVAAARAWLARADAGGRALAGPPAIVRAQSDGLRIASGRKAAVIPFEASREEAKGRLAAAQLRAPAQAVLALAEELVVRRDLRLPLAAIPQARAAAALQLDRIAPWPRERAAFALRHALNRIDEDGFVAPLVAADAGLVAKARETARRVGCAVRRVCAEADMELPDYDLGGPARTGPAARLLAFSAGAAVLLALAGFAMQLSISAPAAQTTAAPAEAPARLLAALDRLAADMPDDARLLRLELAGSSVEALLEARLPEDLADVFRNAGLAEPKIAPAPGRAPPGRARARASARLTMSDAP